MNPKRRLILVVDREHESCSLLPDVLSAQGFIVKLAHSGGEALDIVQTWVPDLVLLDQDLDGLTGLQTLKELKFRNIPCDVIFVSENASATMVSKALNAGADDYIRKPYSMIELFSRIKVRLRIRDLCEDLSQANQRLADLSQKDDLTGLYNMRSMYEKIGMEIERARRTRSHLACVMMDMDHFKTVNDKNDHLFGSFVLKEVGKILKVNMRVIDFAARYGGDEFLMILPETDQHGAHIFTERLRHCIENTTFTDGQNSIKLTASMGFSLYSYEKDLDAKDLVRIADHGLYEAKKRGRNRIINIQDNATPTKKTA